MNASRTIFILIILIALAFVMTRFEGHIEKDEKLELVEETLPSPPTPKAPTPPPTPRLQDAETPKPVAPSANAESKENPYHANPFNYRKLDLPLPRSLEELLSKRTEFKEAQLPDINPAIAGGDGDLLTGKCEGSFKDKAGNLKPIYLFRDTGGVGVGFGEVGRNAKDAEWSMKKGNLKAELFDNDPYSLILEFGDRYLLYLKFHSWGNIPYAQQTWRYWNGYLVMNAFTKPQTVPVVLVEEGLFTWDREERDPRDPPMDWPKLFDLLAPVAWDTVKQ